MTTQTLPQTILAIELINSTDDPDAFCDSLCDHLLNLLNSLHDNICDETSHDTFLDAISNIMRAARRIDPTFSDHAAHIRDTIRDNFDTSLMTDIPDL